MIRVRPATTLLVLLIISFAFQLIAILSVPVTKSIYLSEYEGYKFGVFGLCSNSTCTGIQVGYSVNDIDGLSGFSLPSNARHSVSKLLIVHPISAGFSLVLLFCSLIIHWHGPSNSLRFLFFLLLWTIPSFLLCLLSFLVDILLFVPHMAWGGWIVLAATVLIAVSSVLLCIMRRTVSSRKSTKFGRSNTNGEDYYQLEPLNYGYGTVDGGSYKGSKDNDNDSDNEENVPFVQGDSTANFDNSMQYTRTNDDLNNYPSTALYDSMRGSNDPSAQSGYSRYNQSSPIRAPSTSYRGGYDHYINPILPYEETAPSAPYPSEIPSAEVENTPIQNAPYPTDDTLNLLQTSPSKPLGPRPMPNSNPETPLLPSEQFNDNDDEAERLLAAPEIERTPTFRTKIEQTLNSLQPDNNSSNSLSNSLSNSPTPLINNKRFSAPINRDIGQISFDDETSGDFTNDTSRDLTNDINNEQQINFTSNNNDDDIFTPSTIKQSSPNKDGEITRNSTVYSQFNDTASSNYSSRIPSVMGSINKKPSDLSLQKNGSLTRSNNATTNTNLLHPSSSDSIEYPYPDPLERRSTPAPSFTNESTLSSNFTSVSQRGVNPIYFENNPQEHRELLQRQIEQQLNINTRNNRTAHLTPNTSDALIASNPDFSVGTKMTKGRKGRR